MYLASDRLEEAFKLQSEAVSTARKTWGEGHHDFAKFESTLTKIRTTLHADPVSPSKEILPTKRMSAIERYCTAASDAGDTKSDEDDDESVFKMEVASTITRDSTPPQSEHCVDGGLSLGGMGGVVNGTVRYARLEGGDTCTMVVDCDFHVLIGFFQPLIANGEPFTQHAQLMQYAKLELEDVLFAGAVACTESEKHVKVYKTRYNSGTVNEKHWQNRSLSELAKGVGKAQYFERAMQRIAEKVRRGEMYWVRDYARVKAAEEQTKTGGGGGRSVKTV